MESKKERGPYLKTGLTKEETRDLFQIIEKESGLKWDELEAVFSFGSGSSTGVDGGGKPGSSLRQYAKGLRSLPAATARRVLGIAADRGWLTDSKKNEMGFRLLIESYETDCARFERALLHDLQTPSKKILHILFRHPDLSLDRIETSIDFVVAPLLKRMLREIEDPELALGRESFDAVFGRRRSK